MEKFPDDILREIALFTYHNNLKEILVQIRNNKFTTRILLDLQTPKNKVDVQNLLGYKINTSFGKYENIFLNDHLDNYLKMKMQSVFFYCTISIYNYEIKKNV